MLVSRRDCQIGQAGVMKTTSRRHALMNAGRHKRRPDDDVMSYSRDAQSSEDCDRQSFVQLKRRDCPLPALVIGGDYFVALCRRILAQDEIPTYRTSTELLDAALATTVTHFVLIEHAEFERASQFIYDVANRSWTHLVVLETRRGHGSSLEARIERAVRPLLSEADGIHAAAPTFA
jgi:hypothetical protein